MAIEFLGHKAALLEFLMGPIEEVTGGRPHRVADLFCGTGAVSSELAHRGHQVVAVDQMGLCATFAEAALLGDRSYTPLGGYDAVLAQLNALPGTEGFVTRHYSPRSAEVDGQERRYFTVENALRIDAIRARIQAWEPQLTRGERARLLADLVSASNAVSNIAGTYGCYLKHWKARARAPLQVRPARSAPIGEGHQVILADVEAVLPSLEVELVYADPPYTKRQYGAYYHVPETIVLDDAPPLEGSTGLRPWTPSPWCYRRHAPAALTRLVAALRCQTFFLSYNEDGQIPHERILDILGARGQVRVHEIRRRRYKSAALPHLGNHLAERLYQLDLRP